MKEITRIYLVSYCREKPLVLSDSETISVVVGELRPPRRRIVLSSGRLQQRCSILSSLSVREGSAVNSVPVILRQDWSDIIPPQTRPEQLE